MSYSLNIQPPPNGFTAETIQQAGRWESGESVSKYYEDLKNEKDRNTKDNRKTNLAPTADDFPAEVAPAEMGPFRADQVPYYLVFGEEGKEGNLRNLNLMDCFPCSCPTFAGNANNPVRAHAYSCGRLAEAHSTIDFGLKFVHFGGKDGNENHFAILGPIADVPAANVVAAYCKNHNLLDRVLVLTLPTGVVNSPMWFQDN